MPRTTATNDGATAPNNPTHREAREHRGDRNGTEDRPDLGGGTDSRCTLMRPARRRSLRRHETPRTAANTISTMCTANAELQRGSGAYCTSKPASSEPRAEAADIRHGGHGGGPTYARTAARLRSRPQYRCR